MTIADLTATLHELSGEVTALRQRVRDLEAALAERDAVIAAGRARIAELEAQIYCGGSS